MTTIDTYPDQRELVTDSLDFAADSLQPVDVLSTRQRDFLAEVRGRSWVNMEYLGDINEEDYEYEMEIKTERQQALKEAQENNYVLGGELGVIINIPFDKLMSVLIENYRVLAVHETGKSGGGSSKDHRVNVETMWGVRDSVDNPQERAPVSGTVATKEESIRGTRLTRLYGSCVIHIRDSVAKERIVFTVGDSLLDENTPRSDDRGLERTRMFLNPDEVGAAKVIQESRVNTDPVHYGYVEAIIVGGVDVDDIESIGLARESLGDNPSETLTALREMYPSLDIYIYMPESDGEVRISRARAEGKIIGFRVEVISGQ